jgi:hypothetical protein
MKSKGKEVLQEDGIRLSDYFLKQQHQNQYLPKINKQSNQC